MKYPIYSYRDIKSGFGGPVVDQSDSTAIRGFSYAINGNNGIMNFSPNDFDLYKIGMFDSDTGVIVPEVIPVLIVNGSSLVGD